MGKVSLFFFLTLIKAKSFAGEALNAQELYKFLHGYIPIDP